MKKIITGIIFSTACALALAQAPAAPAPAQAASAPKYKTVCKEKDGKKVCKKIRVHKKLEGKPVPTK